MTSKRKRIFSSLDDQDGTEKLKIFFTDHEPEITLTL